MKDFNKLWVADTISVFGSQITQLALPLTAALLLDASPPQMGLLVAMGTLPFGLFSLHAGAIFDRRRKLPLIRLVTWSRAGLLLVVPLAAYFGLLRMEILYAVAFLLASHAAFADVGYQTLIARLVAREELVEANSRFGLSEASATIAGPSLAGLLVQWLTAPFAILLDAILFFVSGCVLGSMKLREPPPEQRPAGITLWHEIREGLRAVRAHPVLRWTGILLAAWQFLYHMLVAVFVLFAVREAGLSAGTVGLIYSTAGLGFFAGSLYVKRVSRRIGLGPTMLSGMYATGLGWAIISLAGEGTQAAAALILALLCQGFGAGLFFLTHISLRQGVTPERLLARVISTMRFIAVAATPLGALLGGALGEAIGLRATVALVAVGGIALATVAMLYSPLKPLKDMPEPGMPCSQARD